MNGRLRILNLAVGAISIALVFLWLQFSLPSICCGDFDGYYHIKWSQLLWQGLRAGHFPSFNWLPLTTLNPSRYADQHLLFHLLLIPFTWFGDLRFGGKLAAALFGSAAVFSLYWLVLRYRIRYPMLWLLALLGCSWLFYARLNMTKAQSISILFIVAGIVLLFERRYAWLTLAAFLYVWTYNLFVMLGVLAVIWVAVVWWTERRLEWRPLLWTAVGMVAGFVINPYFPNNVRLFLEHLGAKSGQLSMPEGVGVEWYSLPSWDFLTGSLVGCICMALGFIAFGYALSISAADRKRVQRPLLLMVFSTFLLVIAIRSNRFLEYWPPFAVLFAAFSTEAVQSSGSGENLEQDLVPRRAGSLHGRIAFVLAIAIPLAGAMFYNLHTTRATITSVTKDPSHYQLATEWMRANIPSGALIYDVNWSDFPKLFFYDTDHKYVAGLDRIYLQDQHPELARLNDRLSRHEEQDPAAAIRSLFAAASPAGLSYLFVGDDPAPPSPEWFRYIMKTGKFKQIYADKECAILQVLDSPENAVSTSSPPAATTQPTSKWDNPEQRKTMAADVHRRFGGDIYGTVENFDGVPGLLVHNKKANEAWAQKLLESDLNSVKGEAMWQLGFRRYAVTNEDDIWVAAVEGNKKYRALFSPDGPAK